MIISIKGSDKKEPENIEKEEMPIKKENVDFWTDEEKRFFADLERIEKSSMLWPEKKFYSTLCFELFAHSNYYVIALTIGELLGWTKSSFSLKKD